MTQEHTVESDAVIGCPAGQHGPWYLNGTCIHCGKSAQAAEIDAGCPTCEAITPAGCRRREMGGFVCPTCGHKTPPWSVTPPEVD